MASRRLYDCVVFNDELDLLEVRLRCNALLVDVFLIVEATRAFDGSPKPLHFLNARARYADWHEKIRHVAVEDMPAPVPDRWAAEVHQRNAIMRGLHDASENDIVLISDADEIVHPEVLASLKESVTGLTGIEMPSTCFRANWRVPKLDEFACAARAVPFGQLTNPHNQRNHVRPTRVIRDGGRHFTYLLDVRGVQEKFAKYAHSELDNDRDRSSTHIARAERMGLDVRSRTLVRVVSVTELCELERSLLKLRPDCFDFREFERHHARWRFRWYAEWRANQMPDTVRLHELDEQYDVRTRAVMGCAFEAVWLSCCYRYPRRRLGALRRALRSQGGRG